MNLISVLLVAVKRLWNNKSLALCSVIGLTTTVALMSSIPLYADAANYKVFQEQLGLGETAASSEEGGAVARRPPFAFMYRYIGAWYGSVEIESFDPVDQYIREQVPWIIGLPVENTARYVRTDNFALFPSSEAQYLELRQPLGWTNIGFVSGIEDYVDFVEGQFPPDAQAGDEIIDVMLSNSLASEWGVQTGETFIAFMRAPAPGPGEDPNAIRKPLQFTVRVVGIWAPKDITDQFWFYSPQALGKTLLISENSFRNRIATAMQQEVYTAIWYTVFDGDSVRTDDVPQFLGRINYANSHVSALLPNAVLDLSPEQALQNYRWTTFVMTIVLYVFSIPILGLVLYFISLIGGLIVERQRGEIAILKSRGTGDMQVFSIYALEGLVVGVIGFVLGMLVAKQVAIMMGNTVSFLAFGTRQALPVVITRRAILLGLLGVGMALVASLAPAMRASRLTIVTYKRDRARALERPFWQRYFLDILLFVPAAYGYYILKNRGTINVLQGQASGDPFNDPLLFLVPTITIFATSLLLVRLFPLIMELLARLSSYFLRSLSVVLAFRQLARVSKQYTGALLLLVLTLSLATFTASMARTLDQSLKDSMYYRYGADYQLVEMGENPAAMGVNPALLGMGDEGGEGAAETAGGWVFVPVSEHLKVPQIEAATRVGRYTVSANVGRGRVSGQLFGIDRMDFPQVGFFRRDFAPSQLGTLMNRLAIDDSALLVSPNFMADFSLNAGDKVDLTVSAYGEVRTVSFIIADVVRYFPTYYPSNDLNYLFVANLDYLFNEMGGLFPYDVWIRTAEHVDPNEIQAELVNLDIRVLYIQDSRSAVVKEQAQPDRAGVFGILSVGFVAAALLTTLGVVLHSFIAFRRRFIEFGVLRAIGLSVSQMITFLGFEQFVLIGSGVTAGTAIGVWVSNLFIPFLQVGTDKYASIPPFVVLIAWDDVTSIYFVFGAILLLAVAGMIWLLARLKIFEAVKLGEAV
ncbi:MAG: ABC transporter permease [Chloroflexi bacterium]|jgi:putative ABC transport system permease protein|nr:ABC transporter permease [Chloroflexota bacterium]